MKHGFFIDLIFVFQALTLVSVGLNLFLVRQVFGFIFLAFLPGFLILKLFRMRLGF
jgi:uncharacterized membrane protein